MVRFGKCTGLDIIYEESDPKYLQAEIGTHWIQHDGPDPAVWGRRINKRMPIVQMTMKNVGVYALFAFERVVSFVSACSQDLTQLLGGVYCLDQVQEVFTEARQARKIMRVGLNIG